jgi:hypothetical protein
MPSLNHRKEAYKNSKLLAGVDSYQRTREISTYEMNIELGLDSERGWPNLCYLAVLP